MKPRLRRQARRTKSARFLNHVAQSTGLITRWQSNFTILPDFFAKLSTLPQLAQRKAKPSTLSGRLPRRAQSLPRDLAGICALSTRSVKNPLNRAKRWGQYTITQPFPACGAATTARARRGGHPARHAICGKTEHRKDIVSRRGDPNNWGRPPLSFFFGQDSTW